MPSIWLEIQSAQDGMPIFVTITGHLTAIAMRVWGDATMYPWMLRTAHGLSKVLGETLVSYRLQYSSSNQNKPKALSNTPIHTHSTTSSLKLHFGFGKVISVCIWAVDAHVHSPVGFASMFRAIRPDNAARSWQWWNQRAFTSIPEQQ